MERTQYSPLEREANVDSWHGEDNGGVARASTEALIVSVRVCVGHY